MGCGFLQFPATFTSKERCSSGTHGLSRVPVRRPLYADRAGGSNESICIRHTLRWIRFSFSFFLNWLLFPFILLKNTFLFKFGTHGILYCFVKTKTTQIAQHGSELNCEFHMHARIEKYYRPAAEVLGKVHGHTFFL